MTLASILSLAALESDNSAQTVTGPRVIRLRTQVAVVRALADQVKHSSRRENASGRRENASELGEQLAEEITRLEGQLLEVAPTAGTLGSP